jgi:hypothetical protein
MQLDIFKHKDIPLYVVDIPYGFNSVHTEYYTRIPWGEYKRIRFAERVQSIPPYELKIKIFRDYTVRDPKWKDREIDALPAGVVDTVADLIMYVSDSGIIPDREGKINIPAFTTRLNLYRSVASTNVEYQMYTVICLVFKGYTFEMLDRLPFDRIASLFASAERYLLENGILKEPLRIYDPKESSQPKKPEINKEKIESLKNKTGNEEGSMLEQFLRMKEQQASKEKENIVEMPKVENIEKLNISKVIAPERLDTRKSLVPDTKENYIPPKDEYVDAKGMQVKVPGLDINETVYGGFKSEDFAGPFMTDEEALALQIETGNPPAGYELYLARQSKIEQEEKDKEEQNRKHKKKKIFRR